MDYRENLNTNKRIAKSFLKNFEIDLNIYVDSFHFFLFLEQSIDIAQKENEGFFENFNLGACPTLIRDEKVYNLLIGDIFRKFIRKLETKFVYNKINDSNPEVIITDMTFIEAKLYKNILSETEIKTKLSETFSQYYDKTFPKTIPNPVPSKHLIINTYINFFAGDEVDKNYVIAALNHRLKNTYDPDKIRRINNYINYYKTNDIERLTDKQIQQQHRFNLFKNSISKFNENYKNFVSQVTFGKTKFDIPKTNTFFIRYKEKAVDSNLIVNAMKDLNSCANNTIFSFITNDTDFFPLFKEIKNTNELYWMRGYASPSNELKHLVQEDKQIALSEFFEKYHFYRMSNHYWIKQFRDVIDKKLDLDEMAWVYNEKLRDEELEIEREKEEEIFWNIHMEELKEMTKSNDDFDKD